jgi:ribosomal protein L11 methyltransferase
MGHPHGVTSQCHYHRAVATYPALEVRSRQTDALLVLADDVAATALEERDGSVRLFFPSERRRALAHVALEQAGYRVEPIDVDDEDWARRSQEDLAAVTVGRITVIPGESSAGVAISSPGHHAIVIRPSTGFGTGHHPSTRLCLHGLQRIELRDRFVLDLGTGSGILAIAARTLGAAGALGIDNDPDAIAAAAGNLQFNPESQGVEFRVADLASADLPIADLVTANLTGTLLCRAAREIRGRARPGGRLIASGVLDEERDAVVQAYLKGAESSSRLEWEAHEQGWTGLTFVL